MALGEITRQLAQQAIGEAVKGASTPAPPDHPCATVLAQLQAMQKALKEDEELLVLCHAAGETVRVVEIFLPSWQVAVLTAIDKERGVVRVISALDRLDFVCKAVKAHNPAKPARINIIPPRG